MILVDREDLGWKLVYAGTALVLLSMAAREVRSIAMQEANYRVDEHARWHDDHYQPSEEFDDE